MVVHKTKGKALDPKKYEPLPKNKQIPRKILLPLKNNLTVVPSGAYMKVSINIQLRPIYPRTHGSDPFTTYLIQVSY